MSRPSPLSRPGPRLRSGLGPPLSGDVITYDGHVGTDVAAALTGRPPTHVEASTDPTVSDDNTDGHVVGCRWINLAGAEEFVAVSVATGAAVWESTTSGGGGSLDVTDGTTTVSPTTTIDFEATGDATVDVTDDGGGVARVTIGATGGGGSGDYALIDDETLGSDQANITFTGIASTYRDLIIVAQARSSRALVIDDLLVRVGNGSIDTGSNYQHFFSYTGSAGSGTVNSGGSSSLGYYAGIIGGASGAAGMFSAAQLTIVDYASTTLYRQAIVQSYTADSGTIYKGEGGGSWRNTSAAIDQVLVYAGAGNLKAGTRVCLYGRG